MAGGAVCTLFVPEMWDKVLESAFAASPELSALAERVPLPIEETGLHDTAYKWAKDEAARRKTTPILLLPISHCSLNISDQTLRILGPAVATRNDIFVFRPIKPRPRTTKTAKFNILVKDTEITTSNALRVAIMNWSVDLFLHAPLEMLPKRLRESAEGAREEVPKLFRFYAKPDRQARLEELLGGRYDAGIFMGDDLFLDCGGTETSLFSDCSILDVLNINRVINRIYNVREFPRAVFSTFSDVAEGDLGRLEAFTAVYNAAVSSTAPAPDSGNDTNRRGEWRGQVLCPTGASSSVDQVRTLVRFTYDINTPEIMSMREEDATPDREELAKSRSIGPADFIWWPQNFPAEFKAALLQTFSRHLKALAKKKKQEAFNDIEAQMKVAFEKCPPQTKKQIADWINSNAGNEAARISEDIDALWDQVLGAVDARFSRLPSATEAA